jgi:hypothetical protein
MLWLNTVSLLQQYQGLCEEKSPIMGLFFPLGKENEAAAAVYTTALGDF